MPNPAIVDKSLLHEARRIGKHKTDKATIAAALRSYIRLRKQRTVLDLFGKVDYYPDYDYKALRGRR